MRLVRQFLLLAALLAVPGIAAAQESMPQGSTMAVVDVQRLLRESAAGQAIEQQMTNLRAEFGEEVSEREAMLRQEERELSEQVSILAQDVFAERRRQFEEKVQELQRSVMERQQGLEQAYAGGINQVRQVIVEIIQGMVEERGIDVVIPRTTILIASRELDITEDVLAELNRRLPTVQLDLPAGG